VKKLATILAASVLAIAGNAQAAYSGYGYQIDQVRQWNGNLVIRLETAWTGSPTCTGTGYEDQWFVLEDTHTDFEIQAAIILSAYSTGSAVAIGSTVCSDEWNVGQVPMINTLDMDND